MARTAVVAGTASAVVGRVSHKQTQKYAAQDQQAADAQASQQQAPAAAAPQPAPAPAPGGDDITAQLQRLVDLKTQGLLSEAEFEAAKAKLLAG